MSEKPELYKVELSFVGRDVHAGGALFKYVAGQAHKDAINAWLTDNDCYHRYVNCYVDYEALRTTVVVKDRATALLLKLALG